MSLDELFDRPERPQAFEGVILDNADNAGSDVRVALVNFDENLAFGPCPWTPRGDGVLPSRGDRALVVFSDEREPWIVAYQPA